MMLAIKQLPLDYVLARVSLTRADVKVGLLRRALVERDVEALVEKGILDEGVRASDLVEEINEALPPDWEVIGDSSQYPQRAAPDLKLAEAKWAYLQLAWLWDHRAESSDPLIDVAGLWDGFGLPDEIEDLVYFMPPRNGQPVEFDALMDRWRDHLASCEAKYRPDAAVSVS
jgi:hypothetical protein